MPDFPAISPTVAIGGPEPSKPNIFRKIPDIRRNGAGVMHDFYSLALSRMQIILIEYPNDGPSLVYLSSAVSHVQREEAEFRYIRIVNVYLKKEQVAERSKSFVRITGRLGKP
jgi:hypothetical protein